MLSQLLDLLKCSTIKRFTSTTSKNHNQNTTIKATIKGMNRRIHNRKTYVQ